MLTVLLLKAVIAESIQKPSHGDENDCNFPSLCLKPWVLVDHLGWRAKSLWSQLWCVLSDTYSAFKYGEKYMMLYSDKMTIWMLCGLETMSSTPSHYCKRLSITSLFASIQMCFSAAELACRGWGFETLLFYWSRAAYESFLNLWNVTSTLVHADKHLGCAVICKSRSFSPQQCHDFPKVATLARNTHLFPPLAALLWGFKSNRVIEIN